MQKIIPPVLLLISALAMMLLHFTLPGRVIIPNPFHYSGLILLISGLLIARKVRNAFYEAHTEIHTFRRPKQLVTNGLFKYSRNPIYSGFVLTLVGLNILLGSLMPFLVILLFIALTHFWYIPFEENCMQKQFGKDYEDYKKKVRRWI